MFCAMFALRGGQGPALTSKTKTLPRIAIFLSESSKLTKEQAEEVLRSKNQPDPREFVILKGKEIEFVVERTLVEATREKNQISALSYLMTQMRTQKRAVALSELPQPVREGIADLIGSPMNMVSPAKGQVRLEAGVNVNLDGRSSPSTTVLIQKVGEPPAWGSFDAEPSNGQTSRGSGSNPGSQPKASIQPVKPAMDELRILTSKELGVTYRYLYLAEAMKLLLEARGKAMQEYNLALRQLGKEMAATDPQLSEWANQNTQRVGDLPAGLQSDLRARGRQLPGWVEPKDWANQKIDLIPCLIVSLADRPDTSYAFVITFLKG